MTAITRTKCQAKESAVRTPRACPSPRHCSRPTPSTWTCAWRIRRTSTRSARRCSWPARPATPIPCICPRTSWESWRRARSGRHPTPRMSLRRRPGRSPCSTGLPPASTLTPVRTTKEAPSTRCWCMRAPNGTSAAPSSTPGWAQPPPKPPRTWTWTTTESPGGRSSCHRPASTSPCPRNSFSTWIRTSIRPTSSSGSATWNPTDSAGPWAVCTGTRKCGRRTAT